MNIHTQLVRPATGTTGDDPHRAAAAPIYQTATFRQPSAERFTGFDYARSGNPTRAALEDQLAGLEHAQRAFVFASGLAALSAVASLVHSGERILAATDLYGGTFRLFSKILPRQGIHVDYADATDPAAFERALRPGTKLVHIETPTNPLWRIVDIHAIAQIAHRHGALLCVDNTALSPYLQNPINHGADIVIHSATKYLCGHSDVTAGVVCVNDPELAEQIYLVQNGQGAPLGAHDCFLLARSIKTLAVRLDRQQAGAERIARFLADHPAVRRVYYPGLPEHPGYEIHRRQAHGGGGVLSVQLGSPAAAVRFAEATKLFDITVSFGSIASSISVPAHMSHASVPAALRERCLPPADLVRISVGIEDSDDLIEDLSRALDSIEAGVCGGSAARRGETVVEAA